MPAKIVLNLPVTSLDRSIGFFTRLGFLVDTTLTSDTAAHLVMSDQASVMLITEPVFGAVTGRAVTDTATSAETVVQLKLDSREQVDQFVNAAIGAGGRIANPPSDQGFLYGRSFRDLDGHLWDAFHVDLSMAPATPADGEATP